LLPDTHAVLWLLAGDPRLSDRANELLGARANEVLLSAAVVWEVAIKRSLGKLEAPDDLVPVVVGAGAVPLPVTVEHADAVGSLPWHHRDPFDRVLIAQAQLEGAVLVSADVELRDYGVSIEW
jgi:PIN domain nuclease of toxin-antitoxin system